MDEPQQTDTPNEVVDATDRRLERLAGLEYPLAEAHLLFCQVAVDLGKLELPVTDEV
jgi:hypothetical protein